MQDIADIALFITGQPEMMRVLEKVEELGLPDCWVGAGFVRNRIWDARGGRAKPDAQSDIDVVYFDTMNSLPQRDTAVERQLSGWSQEVVWSVKNQARMHRHNGDRPYLDTEDAIRHWPETATAIAARARGGQVELIAPYGIFDLLNFIARPTPAFAHKLDIYRARLEAKNWQVRWPRLTVLHGAVA
jgi:hypothetical protein